MDGSRYDWPGPEDLRTEDAKRLWSAAGIEGRLPGGSWPRYLADAGYRRACQLAILREGVVVLSDVPPEPGGACGFVDGFRAAATLRELDPAA